VSNVSGQEITDRKKWQSQGGCGYILPPLSLQDRGTMRTTTCIEDQYGDRVVYHCRMDVPFGILLAKYLRSMGMLPIGGLFLSNGKMIGLNETPEGMGFDTGYHVIIFINLLMFIDHDNLEYQDDYPLTIGHERKGALDKHTMRDAIDASIQRGHTAEIFPKGDEVLPSPHK
jgi:hypothetical protein